MEKIIGCLKPYYQQPYSNQTQDYIYHIITLPRRNTKQKASLNYNHTHTNWLTCTLSIFYHHIAIIVKYGDLFHYTDTKYSIIKLFIELSNQVQHLDKKELNKSCGER